MQGLAQTRWDPYSPTVAQQSSHSWVSLARGTRGLSSPQDHRPASSAGTVSRRPSRPARLPGSLRSLSFQGAARPQRTDRHNLPPDRSQEEAAPSPARTPGPWLSPPRQPHGLGGQGQAPPPRRRRRQHSPTTRSPLTAGSRRHIRRAGQGGAGGGLQDGGSRPWPSLLLPLAETMLPAPSAFLQERGRRWPLAALSGRDEIVRRTAMLCQYLEGVIAYAWTVSSQFSLLFCAPFRSHVVSCQASGDLWILEIQTLHTALRDKTWIR